MCYFDLVPLKKVHRKVSKAKPIKAWKFFKVYEDKSLHSPLCGHTLAYTKGWWYKATSHGFYALTTRAEARRERRWGCTVRRVLLAGHIREYGGYTRKGYRAQWMKIV